MVASCLETNLVYWAYVAIVLLISLLSLVAGVLKVSCYFALFSDLRFSSVN